MAAATIEPSDNKLHSLTPGAISPLYVEMSQQQSIDGATNSFDILFVLRVEEAANGILSFATALAQSKHIYTSMFGCAVSTSRCQS